MSRIETERGSFAPREECRFCKEWSVYDDQGSFADGPQVVL